MSDNAEHFRSTDDLLGGDSLQFDVEGSICESTVNVNGSIEDRLSKALSCMKLEHRYPAISEELDSPTHFCRHNTDQLREALKMLAQARAMQADIQDERDTLECEVSDCRHRIMSLEDEVSQWRAKYEGEVAKNRAYKDELCVRLRLMTSQAAHLSARHEEQLSIREQQISSLKKQLGHVNSPTNMTPTCVAPPVTPVEESPSPAPSKSPRKSTSPKWIPRPTVELLPQDRRSPKRSESPASPLRHRLSPPPLCPLDMAKTITLPSFLIPDVARVMQVERVPNLFTIP